MAQLIGLMLKTNTTLTSLNLDSVPYREFMLRFACEDDQFDQITPLVTSVQRPLVKH